jgi:NADH-quinone oxidoreductase subunit L
MTEPVASSLPLWILLAPLFGFLFNGIAYPLAAKGMSRTHPGVAGGFAVLAMLVSFTLACVGFAQLQGGAPALTYKVYQWAEVADFSIGLDLRFDPLSAVMALIITGIGSLIHLYSIGYMAHEPGVARFFAYLNLFCSSMLLLVLSDNLLFLFFGWEGVGLCSYLLISYWYGENANADAARKAFLVNRVGDLGFVLAMCLLFSLLGTLSFSSMPGLIKPEMMGSLGIVALLLFFAATGKSAQLPLYVWLPDAMAGPTPVSALIHAATMVTAGIYLFARMHFLFDLAPAVMTLVAWTGALTAVLAGTIALAQHDIKKVLAYSTVSQLGFMFLAAGVGAYHAAIFHLMTHAFFKALLFLGAGSVIHACDGEQDLRKMGGLAKALPLTHATMLLGSAAIVGLPFFSGFFSKDEILYETLALARGGWLLFGLGLFAALLTSLYTIRLLSMAFWGQARAGLKGHESPLVMTLPLMVLAVLASLGGLLGIPQEMAETLGLGQGQLLSTWLSGVVPAAAHAGEHAPLSHGAVSFLAVGLSVLGLGFGYRVFRERFELPLGGLKTLLEGKYFVDEIYMALFVRPLYRLADLILKTIEIRFLQNIGYWMGVGSQWSGDRLRAAQNGDLQAFALMISVGLAVLVGFLIFWTRV